MAGVLLRRGCGSHGEEVAVPPGAGGAAAARSCPPTHSPGPPRRGDGAARRAAPLACEELPSVPGQEGGPTALPLSPRRKPPTAPPILRHACHSENRLRLELCGPC